MCTAAESDHVAVTMCHGPHQSGDLLVADGRVDDIAELEELVTGQPALLVVINHSECIHNGCQ